MKIMAEIMIILSMALILMAPRAAAYEPVAPMVPVRVDLANLLDVPREALDAMLRESEAKIPSQSTVGVSVPSGTLWLGGDTRGEMENVLLLSALHPDQVRQYYLEQLPDMPGWKWSEEFGLFCKAEGAITLERLMSSAIPVIEIEALSPDNALLFMVDPGLRQELQTLLRITYPAR